MYKCTEEQFKICTKSNLCHLCDGKRLYTEPKWMAIKKKEQERKAAGLFKKKKEGMDFEKRVTKKYNKKLTPSGIKDSASRRPGSGSIWSMPGDIVTDKELFECKERGSTTSTGEKTISIPKAHLDKVKLETHYAGKDVWYYIFSYKGTEDIYLVKDYNDELAMIEQINMLKKRIVELENRIGDIE